MAPTTISLGGAGGLVTASAFPTSLAGLGADLLRWWEPSAETVDVDGSGNASMLYDRQGVSDIPQATDANRPQYSATGGPSSIPALIMQGTARFMSNASIGITAGKRLSVFLVVQLPGGSTTRIPAQLYKNSSNATAVLYQEASSAKVATCQSGASHVILTLTSPTLASIAGAWVLFEAAYEAAGATTRINAAITTPDAAGTGAAAEITRVDVGHSSLAGGRFQLGAIVDNTDSDKRAFVHSYVQGRTGLVLT